MIYICTFKYTVQHWEMLLFFLVLLLFFTIIIYNIWLRVKLILTKRKNTSCIPHFTEGNEGQRGCVTCLKKHIRVRLNIQVFWPWLVFFFNNDILHVRQSSKSVQSLFFFFFPSVAELPPLDFDFASDVARSFPFLLIHLWFYGLEAYFTPQCVQDFKLSFCFFFFNIYLLIRR